MTHADETRAAAAVFDHEWDERAVDWPLTSESVVVEVGGYKGRWALQIAERYGPRLYVFEPQEWAAEVCREVLGDRALVLGFALGNADGTFPMGEWETDGCSFVKTANNEGRMREIKSLFTSLKINHIDLMLMNIEGYEYTLIRHMIINDILPQRLMVQFHRFADPDGTLTAAIKAALLMVGYRVAWDYGDVLSAWERL